MHPCEQLGICTEMEGRRHLFLGACPSEAIQSDLPPTMFEMAPPAAMPDASQALLPSSQPPSPAVQPIACQSCGPLQQFTELQQRREEESLELRAAEAEADEQRRRVEQQVEALRAAEEQLRRQEAAAKRAAEMAAVQAEELAEAVRAAAEKQREARREAMSAQQELSAQEALEAADVAVTVKDAIAKAGAASSGMLGGGLSVASVVAIQRAQEIELQQVCISRLQATAMCR